MLIVNPAAPMARARKLAEGGGVLLLVAIIAIVASAFRQHVGEPVLEALSAARPWTDVVRSTLVSSILALPSVFLILSLLELRAALRECFYTAEAGAALRHAGYWALWALITKIVLAPSLYAFFALSPLSLIVIYESFDLGLIGLAALLMLAGRVLEAANSRADHDRFV